MCGRYYIEIDNEELQSIVAAVENKTAIKTGEIRPTNTVPVLSPTGNMTAMRWGFPKHYGKGVVINARNETATKLDSFWRPMIDDRCLIPASWYFEWKEHESKKVKYSFFSPDKSPLWLAGLSQTNHETGESLFVILTRPAWSGISFIHDRMPVILPKEKHDEWLNGNNPVVTMSKSVNEVNYEKAEV